MVNKMGKLGVLQEALQHNLVNEFQLAVTVAHYPTGTAKWNPIEHRLFSELSKNWTGVPLETVEVILNYLSSTTTQTGPTVTASLMDSTYERGLKISKNEMDQLNIKPHDDQTATGESADSVQKRRIN